MGENVRDGQDGLGAQPQDAATGEDSQAARSGTDTGSVPANGKLAGYRGRGKTPAKGKAPGKAPSKAPGKAPSKAPGKAPGKARARGAGAPRPKRGRPNRGALVALAIALLACLALVAVSLLDAGSLCGMGGLIHRSIQAYCVS